MSATGVAAAQSMQQPSRFPFGMLAYTGSGISIGICFAQTIALHLFAILGVAGTEIDFNPHLQAFLMWVFALVAIVGLALDRKSCGSPLPLYLGLASFLVIVTTLYGYYSTPVLMMGYTILLTAAFINQSLRLRTLHQRVEEQARELRTAQFNPRGAGSIPKSGEIEKLARLKRFLAPAVAEFLVADESQLKSHRSHIAALFCDMRGFTTFSESMEPEEVMGVLGEYHREMGRLAAEFEATIDHRAGDGLMLFFNDPVPCEQAELKAVRLGDCDARRIRSPQPTLAKIRIRTRVWRRHCERTCNARHRRVRRTIRLHRQRQCREPSLAPLRSRSQWTNSGEPTSLGGGRKRRSRRAH